MTDAPPTVSALVADLRRRARPVGKHGKADPQQGGYSYQGIEDIITMLTPLLEDTGLTLRSELETHDVDTWEYKQGKRAEAHTVTVRYSWLGLDGGVLLIGVFGGCAWDYGGDKGLNKAMTAARKLMLREHLLLSTDEDIDPESITPPERPARSRKPAAKKPTAAPEAEPVQAAEEPFAPTNIAEAKRIVLDAAGGDKEKANLAWQTAQCEKRGWADAACLADAIAKAGDLEWPF